MELNLPNYVNAGNQKKSWNRNNLTNNAISLIRIIQTSNVKTILNLYKLYVNSAFIFTLKTEILRIITLSITAEGKMGFVVLH